MVKQECKRVLAGIVRAGFDEQVGDFTRVMFAVEFIGGCFFVLPGGLVAAGSCGIGLVNAIDFFNSSAASEEIVITLKILVVAFTLLALLDFFLVADCQAADCLGAYALGACEWRRIGGVVGAFH